MQRISLLLILYIFLCHSAYAQKVYQPNWASLDSRPVPDWYKGAKFGIFIHWGIYAVPAFAPTDSHLSVYAKYAEWYGYRLLNDTTAVGDAFRDYHSKAYGSQVIYQDFAKQFRASLFNPDEWSSLLAASGAKYVVLTSKHHDGYALWSSQFSQGWNSMATGPHRDLAGELMRSVKAKGLKMGYYYSLYEWFNPIYKSNFKNYVDAYMIPQLKELVMRYNPDILWADGEWDFNSMSWKSKEFLAWLYNISPVKDSVVVNDRWGKETRGKHGGFFTSEYDHGMTTNGSTTVRTWEECRGMGNSFGYNRAEKLNDYATSTDLIHLLVKKVAAGGNLLLNIGPTAEGTIPLIMQQRLLDIGNWLKVNGEAIYESEPWVDAPDYGNKEPFYYTKKGNDLYMICMKPVEKTIQLKNIKKGTTASLLGFAGVPMISFEKNGAAINISPLYKGVNCGSYPFIVKLKDAL